MNKDMPDSERQFLPVRTPELSRVERERILLGLRCRISMCVREHNKLAAWPKKMLTQAKQDMLAAYHTDANESHARYNKLHEAWPDVRLPAYRRTPHFDKQEGT